MAKDNTALYVGGGLLAAWYFGLLDGLLGAGEVAAIPPANNIVTNPAPTTSAGQQAVEQQAVEQQASQPVSTRSLYVADVPITGGGTPGEYSTASTRSGSIRPVAISPTVSTSPAPVSEPTGGCYTVQSIFGPRRVCP